MLKNKKKKITIAEYISQDDSLRCVVEHCCNLLKSRQRCEFMSFVKQLPMIYSVDNIYIISKIQKKFVQMFSDNMKQNQ